MITKAQLIQQEALADKRAIAAFNVSSIEAVQAVFEAAAEVKTPVILETSSGEAQYLLPEVLAAQCKALGELYNVTYILHLDRGNNLSLIKRCLEAGYNSIASEFKAETYGEIVMHTKEVRAMTNEYGASHEGAIEIVPLRYYEKTFQQELIKTDPSVARQFVEETNVDTLVVSIGNQSGKLKTHEPLDIQRLAEIHAAIPNMPLVLHGGSYLPKETLQQAITNGVAKININSEIRLAYTEKLKENMQEHPDEYAPYRLLTGAKEAMKAVMIEKMQMMHQ